MIGEINDNDRLLLHCIANGDDVGTISFKLYCAESSVEVHKSRLYKKIGAKNAPHAVAWGYKNKILIP